MPKRCNRRIRDFYDSGFLHRIGCECPECESDRWFYQKPWLGDSVKRMPIWMEDGKVAPGGRPK